jgi:hypothetical protein
VDQQEESKREGIRPLQIHSTGHGFITFCRSQAIMLPTRQKAYAKMDRRVEVKQREEYPHNKDPFCNIDLRVHEQ